MTQTDFFHDIRVNWGDCDPARIAYTGRIPVWALESIEAWWAAHQDGDGWFQMELDRNLGTPFVGLSMDFRHPITPRHGLRCKVWPTRLGTTSVTFAVEGYQSDRLCFEGRFTCVFVIADAFAKTAPPPEVRALVEAHLRAEVD